MSNDPQLPETASLAEAQVFKSISCTTWEIFHTQTITIPLCYMVAPDDQVSIFLVFSSLRTSPRKMVRSCHHKSQIPLTHSLACTDEWLRTWLTRPVFWQNKTKRKEHSVSWEASTPALPLLLYPDPNTANTLESNRCLWQDTRRMLELELWEWHHCTSTKIPACHPSLGLSS